MVSVAMETPAWNDYQIFSGVAASLPRKVPFPFCVYNPILGKPTQFYLNQTEH